MESIADDIAQRIDIAINQLPTLNKLIDSANNSVDGIRWASIKLFEEQLIIHLKDLFYIKAVEEINELIGEGNQAFEPFNGEDDNGSLPYEQLKPIYQAVIACADDDSRQEVTCLVGVATAFPILNPFVKQRLIFEVEKIVGFPYTGRDASNVAYPVILNGQEYAWDSSDVFASDLYEKIPFIYDRQEAVNKAEEMANKGQGQALSEYDFIQYGTDSARFMSIAIHAGGLPFTTTDSNGSVNICDDTVAVGWCAFEDNNQTDANRVFVLHNSSNLALPLMI